MLLNEPYGRPVGYVSLPTKTFNELSHFIKGESLILNIDISGL